MTKIKIYRNSHALIVGFELSGHTGYGEAGQDVLCASLSAIAQSVALGLKDVLNIDIEIVRKDNDGYMLVELPKDIDSKLLEKAQVLLDTMLISFEDLVDGYSHYISMEVIENVY